MYQNLPQRFLQRLEVSRLIIYSAISGLVMGLLCSGLAWVLGAAQRWVMSRAGYTPPTLPSEQGVLMAFEDTSRYWLLLLMPLLLLLSFWLQQRSGFKPILSLFIEQFHAGEIPVMRFRQWLQAFVASVLGVLSGVPVGREGAMLSLAQLSVTITQKLSNLTPAERRTVLLSSMASALAVMFHAPIAAAVLVSEVLYRRFDFEVEVVTSNFIAALSAYGVYGTLFGFQPLFELPNIGKVEQDHLIAYFGLGVAMAGVGLLYVHLARAVQKIRQSPQWWYVAGIALLMATVSLWYGGILGDGLGWLQLTMMNALETRNIAELALPRAMVFALLMLIPLLGGILTPIFVLGGLLGALYATLLNYWIAGLDLQIAVSALVGMAALSTTTLKIPLAAILLTSTWGGDALLFPLALATLAAYSLTSGQSILPEQVATRANSGAHIASMVKEILEPPQPKDLLSLLKSQPLQILQTDTEYLASKPVATEWVGKMLSEVDKPLDVTLLAIAREGHIYVPNSFTVFEAEDQIIWIGHPENFKG